MVDVLSTQKNNRKEENIYLLNLVDRHTYGKLRLEGLKSVLNDASNTAKSGLLIGFSKIESALSTTKTNESSTDEFDSKKTSLPLNKDISITDFNETDEILTPNSPNYHSPEACGPDPYDKLTYKIDIQSSGSEAEGYGPSTSLESCSDKNKFYIHSGSEGSVKSWASSLSLDSQTDEIAIQAAEFMRNFVILLFKDSTQITQMEKARFGVFAQEEVGRLWFARFVNAQRVHGKRVSETTFYSLAQFFAIILFECADSDDFAPAKSLMNMCFTFYYEVPGKTARQYVYTILKDQPIFHSLRFWNAAFFEALQCERALKPVATREDIANNKLEALTDDRIYQENITFGQLGTFTTNMHAFGLSRELCVEFLRKQCTIANLSQEQQQMLKDNLENLYKSSEILKT